MKTILTILPFLMFSLTSLSQNISNTRAKELFGYRFISTEEAGFHNVEIPFKEEDLKYDFDSWLVPLNQNGVLTYKLVQTSNLSNGINDTLSLERAKEVISLLSQIRPNFPNEVGASKPYKYFFMTKDCSPSKSGLKFKKVICYSNKQLLIVNLPINAKAGVIEGNSLSYLVRNNSNQSILGFESLPQTLAERSVSVLTLTYSP